MNKEKYLDEMARKINTSRVDNGDEEFLTGEEIDEMYSYSKPLYTKKNRKEQIDEYEKEKEFLRRQAEQYNKARLDEYGEEEYLSEEEVDEMYNPKGIRK